MKTTGWSARSCNRVMSGAPALALALAVALGAAPAGGHAKERADAPVKQIDGATTAPARLNGKLGNGLAYHIEKAAEAGGETSFRLIVRVGQLHGLPEQQVAHVVEHIVIEKLADKAAKGSVWERASRIGARVNAGTGDTSTSYYVDLPESNPAAAAAALAILLDWASPGALSDEEIDRERKAVIEEARQGGYGEENRLAAAQLRALFPQNDALANPRDPIGTLSATAPTMIMAIFEGT
jgi:predicted Zn-dependent peptidase